MSEQKVIYTIAPCAGCHSLVFINDERTTCLKCNASLPMDEAADYPIRLDVRVDSFDYVHDEPGIAAADKLVQEWGEWLVGQTIGTDNAAFKMGYRVALRNVAKVVLSALNEIDEATEGESTDGQG